MNAVTQPTQRELTRDDVERVVKLTLHKVTDEDIARLFDLPLQSVEYIRNTDLYKSIYTKLSTNTLLEAYDTNATWATVEGQALRIVADNLKWNSDPDFALRAAMVSNKAVRRHQANSDPIDPKVGERAVINISQHFYRRITNVQVNQTTEQNEQPREIQKVVDVVSPQQLTSVLQEQFNAAEARDRKNIVDFMEIEVEDE